MCLWFFHSWSKWEDYDKVAIQSMNRNGSCLITEKTFLIQKKVCANCGETRFRGERI